jgi:arabinofuranosyltransferase
MIPGWTTGSRAFGWIIVAAALLGAYQYSVLFPFAIDDAYIVLRYARNLVTTGQLVFNDGERVSALTSPLHALVTAGLYALTGDRVLLASKLLSLACVIGGVTLMLRALRDVAAGPAVVLALLVTSPSVVLWTYGGLETPLLFLVVAAFTAVIADSLRRGPTIGRDRLVGLHLLAAIALLIRYDSVCFFAPALLLTWRHRQDWKSIGLALYVAAIPCIAWFSFALEYFGDVLPTSFYVKTPSYGFRDIVMTAIYELVWLTLLGIAPLLAAAMVARLRGRRWQFEPATLILAAGLAGAWLYGLGMAQKHMMFGFRHGMPYLPAAVGLLLIELRTWRVRPAALAATLLGLLLVHAVHMQRILDVSVNGYWKWSAFSEAGARDLIDMVKIWRASAQDLAADWSKRAVDRPPRVFTYAGGVVPYELPRAYVFEELISTRHHRCARPDRMEAAADYIHAVMTPQNARSAYYNTIVNNPALSLISDRTITIGEEQRRVQVYFNAQPVPLQLPSRVDRVCPADAWRGGPCVSESCFY